MSVADTRSIYVEIDIRGSIDEVWRFTQTPHLHEQWDLRFTEIHYLPRTDADQAQRFLYETRIGLGMTIRGEGETVGQREVDGGQRTSALKFWSDDPRSLIRVGSGYWKYVPREGGTSVRFLTAYDYEVRFGVIGRWVDRWIFRPLMGWATAWSFDRLRLWIEDGIAPAVTMRRSLAHAVSRLAVSFVWVYQGAIPKLIFNHPDELAMLRASGLSLDSAHRVSVGAGWAEFVLGLVILLAWKTRWPLWCTLAVMPLAIIGVSIRSPGFLSAAFNPVSLNVSVGALAAVALLEGGAGLPSASRCVRQPSKSEESAS